MNADIMRDCFGCTDVEGPIVSAVATMSRKLSMNACSQPPVSDATGSSSHSDTSGDLQSVVHSNYYTASNPEGGVQSPERAGFLTWIDLIDELIEVPPVQESTFYSPCAAKQLLDDKSQLNETTETSPSLPSAPYQFGEVYAGGSGKKPKYARFSQHEFNLQPLQLEQSSCKRQLISGDPLAFHSSSNSLDNDYLDHKQLQDYSAMTPASDHNDYIRMPFERSNNLCKVLSPPETVMRLVPPSPQAYSLSGSFPRSSASTPSPVSGSSKSALAQQLSQLISTETDNPSRRGPGSESYSFQHRSRAPTTNSVADLSPHSFPPSGRMPAGSVLQGKFDRSLKMQVEPTNVSADRKNLMQQKQNYLSMQIEAATSSSQPQPSGLHLVHLLLSCAEAVSQEDYAGAKRMLAQLQCIASSQGDSIHRVAAYFTEALLARISGTASGSYIAIRSHEEISSDDIVAAYHVLYQVCPYVKFGHFTCNQAIFEAFEGHQRVHILDLDILQGYQWPALIQALAARPGGALHLRITGVGKPLQALRETGRRLSDLASSLHVSFEFHALGERLENLQSYMLERRPGEILAVNCVNRLHRLLSEPTNSIISILRLIRDLAPTVLTLVEKEASHNGSSFLGRFLEALHYFSAIFDSLDATLPQNSPERAKVESTIFGNEITNIVACEGPERIERHEKLESWWKIMESIGFHSVPLSPNGINQCKLLLGLYPCDGYSAVEDKGCLILRWQDRPILAVSTWRC
ncbi:hypothetical protein O6H91_22G005500 [Diphasiastrum complanatum]|uniref:Uncharacterized protein n=1 Tax=Diphasiastrum complanatum TaxID=34168 RepID=A0ACC2ACC4_DIPCM|nr:hypothetical protein O6H91_22G005500 [Diphasiastrum complanatum]